MRKYPCSANCRGRGGAYGGREVHSDIAPAFEAPRSANLVWTREPGLRTLQIDCGPWNAGVTG